jgi:RNA polymerase sigma factor (sigma-70 family)
MPRVGASEDDFAVVLERGDWNAAITWLIRLHEADLRAFVARRLPAWAKPSEIDEVCQEVWAEALANLSSYRRESPARGWLFGIANHKIVDFLRHHRRLLPLEDIVSKLIEASTLRPSRALAGAELRRIAQTVVETLEPDKRTLIRWRYRDGLKPAQILERLVTEGGAAEVDLEQQVEALSTASREERGILEKRLINLITQRIHRAVLQLIELWKRHEGQALPNV